MSDSELSSLPFNERYFQDSSSNYHKIRNSALDNPETFWSNIAKELSWFRDWDEVLDWKLPFAKWFTGGKINASFNCLDRYMGSELKNKIAYIWEGENGDKRTLTYLQLFEQVNHFADALLKLGVKKGDRIAFYMPMVPEFPIAILAATRIGVTFTVVFSGFSASALADRINDSQAKLVITSDGGFRRGKILKLKDIVDEALDKTSSVEKVIVLKRADIEINMTENRDVWWHDSIKNTRDFVEPEQLESDHPLYILYTSGTTGKPKGVLHGTGGYLTYVYATTKWVFDIQNDDIYWCPADIGWVTGHSYFIFGPLLQGATSIMYEGAPDYPNPERLWEMIDKYKVSIFYFTPTGIRALMKHGDELPKKHNLNSLRLLGTVGEPINPAAWKWYYDVIGNKKCPIVDTWWQTETGGIMLSASPHLGLVSLKPGSATFPLPGIDADIVDEQGNSMKFGEKGFLVIKKPWPGMFLTLYNDSERYKQVYWEKFPGYYYPGDYAIRDHDGYFWLLGRADEVLNVAGHRLGTIEIEDAMVEHAAVAEAAVAGKPDEIKGESIVVFAILQKGNNPSTKLRVELRNHVRSVLGPVATPEEIYFVNMLPKTRSGKIMRRVVKAVASGKDIGDVTTLEDGASVDEIKRTIDEFRQSVED
ncbi:MAG: acetate--CoA ligase [Thaumarchaeota archaeon]|nr:acetate--CoA ligase [Nitrososphaerota archaeon]